MYALKRIPSYTDRILLHSLEDVHSNLHTVHYGTVNDITTSDHAPVLATMTLARDINAEFYMVRSPIYSVHPASFLGVFFVLFVI